MFAYKITRFCYGFIYLFILDFKLREGCVDFTMMYIFSVVYRKVIYLLRSLRIMIPPKIGHCRTRMVLYLKHFLKVFLFFFSYDPVKKVKIFIFIISKSSIKICCRTFKYFLDMHFLYLNMFVFCFPLMNCFFLSFVLHLKKYKLTCCANN